MSNVEKTGFDPGSVEPVEVFRAFSEIAAIPHGSRNTGAISRFLVDFAKEKGLKYRQDDPGNVIIWKDGKGDTPVILQGHMDMVCEKEPGCSKDMSTEGLNLYIDGDELRAAGTTLGGDDGIAVAMALAILDSKDEDLPPVEAIFTVDEEIGMLGAAAIDLTDIQGRTMINIDSEEEGVFTVSCAGGVVAEAAYPVAFENMTDVSSEDLYKISVEGLIGGHSGIEIHKNRANAIAVLGRVLRRLRNEAGIRLICLEGGAKDNAIPVSAAAYISAGPDEAGAKEEGGRTDGNDPDISRRLSEITSSAAEDIRAEYAATDPDMIITCQKTESPSFFHDKDKVRCVMTADSTDAVIYMLTCLPNGIQRMNPDVEGLVQTSLNMGILKTAAGSGRTSGGGVRLTFCVRSSVASEKKMLMDRLRDSMKIIGGDVEFSGDYPGWQYRTHSPLRDLMEEVYEEQYGEKPAIEAVHAGVECGFFADKLPGLDCVSIGPKLSEIHTYRESMNILSVERTYRLVQETLKRLARQ